MSKPANIFANLPAEAGEEVFQTLAATGAVEIERIVSTGQFSPPGFWYDQPRQEWVLLLQGSAVVRFQAGDRLVELRPGDYLEIPAHAKHRVDRTAEGEKTIWLAIHYPKMCD